MKDLSGLRRAAKGLLRDARGGEAAAAARMSGISGKAAPWKLADALHVIAREKGFASWPKLAAAAKAHGLDRATALQRLRIAVHMGRTDEAKALLAADAGLAQADLGIAVALYDVDALRAAPNAATTEVAGRLPLLHLCFSRAHQIWPERSGNAVKIARLLFAAGADPNAALDHEGHPLSALYGALGHARHLALAQALLDAGANPDDGESLYHATELGDARGVKMLLAAGATPRGTNALMRAMDFDSAEMVAALLDAGADPNEYSAEPVGGETPSVASALHQAARRGCSKGVCRLLMDAGANPNQRFQGVTPYAYARAYGSSELARMIADAGGDTALTASERLLARAADGAPLTQQIDASALPSVYHTMINERAHLASAEPLIARLIAAGVPHDVPSATDGATPAHIAGWNGVAGVLEVLLSAGANLAHLNGYGGDILSTILHGSENAPTRAGGDYPACLRLVLARGHPLPRRAIRAAGAPEVTKVLADWAAAHPDQVTGHGIV